MEGLEDSAIARVYIRGCLSIHFESSNVFLLSYFLRL